MSDGTTESEAAPGPSDGFTSTSLLGGGLASALAMSIERTEGCAGRWAAVLVDEPKGTVVDATPGARTIWGRDPVGSQLIDLIGEADPGDAGRCYRCSRGVPGDDRIVTATFMPVPAQQGLTLVTVRDALVERAVSWAEEQRSAGSDLRAAGIVIVTGTAEASRVAWLDPLAERLLEVALPRVSGALLHELDPSLPRGAWIERYEAACSEPLMFRTRFSRPASEPRSYEVRLERVPEAILASAKESAGFEPAGETLVLFVRDRRDLLALEEELEQTRRRWDLVSSAARDGLWCWDLQQNEVAFSARWCALIGIPEVPVRAPVDAWLDRVHPSDREGLQTAIDDHLAGHTPILLHEHRLEHENGTWRWCVVRAVVEYDPHGLPMNLAGSTSDVTHRKNAEERLRYEAFHDSLTGLANRAWLIHRLHEALEGSRRGLPFAVLLLGLDGFKLVNDSFGPSIGDMLLRSIATRLLRNVRAGDTVARLAGDEFLVILDQAEEQREAEVVAERIQRDVARPFDLRGYSVFTSISIGLVIHTVSYIEPEELLRDANIALVRAKGLGRGKCKVFDASMRHETIRRLMLETDLRRALERSELTLNYQPIVSLDNGRLLGFEALARWHHAKQGAISPAEFIPLAEDSGLILNIGKWALVAACEEAVLWSAAEDGQRPWVAVNVSGRQLMQPGFVGEVREIMRLTGIEPERLHLEITESVLMENTEFACEILVALRALGVQLSIDDFGTGYSSLAALRRFPIQTLKVDRAFLAKDANQTESWAIVEAISSLARVLGKEIVIEGVEDAEDARRLRALGCHAAQGYLFARPAPFEQLASIMSLSGRMALARRMG